MFNSITRLQNSFGYFTSVLMAFSIAVSLVSMTQLWSVGAFSSLTANIDTITPKFAAKMTRRFGSADGKPKENVRINFDLEADLSPLFNWNTKQVFVYLTAEYPGRRPDILNKVTFWDKIIKTKDDAQLQLKNTRGAYSIYDIDKKFTGQNATMRLEWNVQPHVGWLVYGAIPVSGTSSFELTGVSGENK